MEEIRLKRKNSEAMSVNSFESGSSNGRLEIQDKPNSSRGSPIKSLPNFPRFVMIGCLTLSPKSLEVESHQVINKLVQSVVRSIGVSGKLRIQIAIVVEKRVTKSRISLM